MTVRLQTDDPQIAWAAGLFEGEGCFTACRARRGPRQYMRASLAMTDEDVVRDFAAAVGVGRVNGPYRTTENRKPQWRWDLHGYGACQAFVQALMPWLGDRRLVQAANCFAVCA